MKRQRHHLALWHSVKDILPDYDERVLIFNDKGVEIAKRVEAEEDGSDYMGHDEGFYGEYAVPGRSFGEMSYRSEGYGQPTHWMPIPKPPALSGH